MDNDWCDQCGDPVDGDGVIVEATKEDPFRVASGYFCSWEHAASWVAAGESGKDFDVIFPKAVPLRGRERLWNAVEPVVAFAFFMLTCALIVIGSWTAANWVFPFANN